MAKGYRPVDRDQQFLMPPDMREWLPESDPVCVKGQEILPTGGQ